MFWVSHADERHNTEKLIEVHRTRVRGDCESHVGTKISSKGLGMSSKCFYKLSHSSRSSFKILKA